MKYIAKLNKHMPKVHVKIFLIQISEQHSDSEQDSQLSNKSSYIDVTKLLIKKQNKFDHRFDYALFHGDFCKFLSCGGWSGK